MTFKWSATDPDGDSLTFDLYLGDRHPLPLLASGLRDTFYYVPTLRPSHTYQWRVEARDPDGHECSSATRRFSTWDSFAFPLAEGNMWVHRGSAWETNFRPFADGVDWQPQRSGVWLQEWIEQRVPRPDGSCAFERALAGVRGSAEYWPTCQLYLNTADGLYMSSDCSQPKPSVVPASEGPSRYRFRGVPYRSLYELLRSSLAELDAGLESSSPAQSPSVYERKVLAYPLTKGARWLHWQLESRLRVDKSVVGTETLETRFGRQRCTVIQWHYDMNGDGIWETQMERLDYVSEIGVVKREIILSDVVVTTYEHPYGIGLVDVLEVQDLTELTLSPIP